MILKKIIFLIFCIIVFQTSKAQVNASFIANDYIACTQLAVQFTDLSSSNTTSWFWDLGPNNGTSALQNPTTNYAPGIHPVCLTASDGTNTDTFCDTIKVYDVPDISFSATPLAGCELLNVQFTNSTITGTGIDSMLWTFGDGASSTNNNPNHDYTTGTYSVNLWVQDNAGCFNQYSVSNYITATNAPITDFSSNNAQNCAIPSLVNFQNTSTDASGATYLWDFGVMPQVTSTAENPSHSYTTAGSYDVTLITTKNGCSDTLVKPNFVTILPQSIDFSTTNTSVCIGETISFTDNSTLSANSWDWDFGVNGVESNSQNPNYSYSAAGLYTVTMVAYIPGCTDSLTRTDYITVNENPTVSFVSSDNDTCGAPFSVDFTSTASVGSTYLWDFGELPNSNLANPTHIYNSTGTFSVSLTVTNSFNCSTTADSINMINVYAPVSNFNISDQIGCAPKTIDFTDLSTSHYGIASWMWDFDDGTTQNGPSNTSHEYTTSGTFSPTLEVTDSLGCTDTYTGPSIELGTKIIPEFSYTPDTACGSSPVTFLNLTDTMNTDSIDWIWNFGDGGIYLGYEPPFDYIYSDTGYMSVTLQTIHSGCQSDTTLDSIIYILPPIARFTEAYDCTDPTNVLFVDESIGPDSWNWFIGDDTVNTQDVNYTFSDTGTYYVLLEVENFISGCTDTTGKSITIVDPFVNFSYDDSIGCTGLTVNFTDLSVDAIGWEWNFGETGWYTSINPSYTFNNPGVFDVTLVIRSLHDCYDTLIIENAISIFDVESDFLADTTSGCVPLDVNFTDSSTTNGGFIVDWFWDFGDGSPTDTTPDASHTYTDIGNFNASLTVTDSAGCTSTKFITIATSGVDVSFINDSITCDYNSAEFTSTTSAYNPIASWDWSFGDNNSSNLENPSHDYLEAGSYDVILTVMDIVGCSGADTTTIFIDSMFANFSASDSIINCAGASSSVTFYSNTPTNTVLWNWNFPSSFENPTVNFSTVGAYDVVLIATNDNGCVATETKPSFITINGPYGTLEASSDSICEGEEIIFSVTNTNSIFQKFVFGGGFGNNTTSTSDSHTYADAGVYLPSVVLRDTTGCEILYSYNTVYVAELNAAIYLDTNYVCNPEMVNLIDSSSSSSPITDWQWSLDGLLYSTDQDTSNNYTVNGTHSIELIVTNAFCSDTVNDYIIVNGPSAIVSNTPTMGCTDLIANFQLSNLISQQQIWNFGEGAAITNTLDSMNYTYSNVGVFYPSVIIQDAHCIDTLLFDSIQVGSLNALIYADSNALCISDSINFTDTSTAFPSITNWTWNFDNGNTSTLQNPTQLYTDTGTFVVQLIVNNSFCEDTATTIIEANGPFATISRTPDIGCIDLNATFELSATNSTNQVWNFGEGADVANNLITMNHLYSTEGTYYPFVIISEANCIDTLLFDSIQVGSLNANFNTDTQYVCAPDLVNFYDSTTSIPAVTNWLWDFGDGNTSTNQFPNNTYTTNGIYSVKLLVDNGLCKDSLTLNQYIVSDTSTTASFQIIPPAIVCPPVSIQFLNKSSADSTIATWEWNFDNGLTNNTQNPTSVSFDTSGVYIVSLDITTIKGCVSRFEDSIEINVIPLFSFEVDSIELCRYDEIELDSLGTDKYYWSPSMNLSCADCPNPTITALNNVVYEVLAVTDEGCEYVDSLTFIVNELPNLIVSEDEKVTNGTTVSVNAFSTENVTFDWITPDNIDCANCPDNDFLANETTEFIVNAIDDFGCITTDTILIEVFNLCDGNSVFLPNIFTPNDDGLNDVLKITTLQNLQTEINYFRIFDRWGKLIFETTDLNESWNGTNLNGQRVPNGVYVYTLEVVCSNGETVLLNGNVTLIR